MSALTTKRPSPAFFVALLALVVALSGTAYAAGLAKDSVGSKQVKNNALKSKDIKDGQLTGTDVSDGSLTGADVNESSLVGVNAATLGGLTAAGLNTRVATDFNANDNALDADGITDVNTVTFTIPVRSVVKLEIGGFFVGNTPTDCPCNMRALARLTTEPVGTGPELVTTANLTDYLGGFARLPYAGVRTLTLNPGTYTFVQTIVRISGATATNTTVGSGYSRLVVTSYPFDATGATPARPAPDGGAPSGSVAAR